MKLVSLRDGKVLARVMVADGLFKKVFGLTVGRSLADGQCFLIRGCKSIHTIGMRYCIDAVFLDRKGEVIKVYPNLKPYRITPFIKEAESVIEFKAGFAEREGITEGHCFRLV